MGYTLVVAEKPSVAATIAGVLGARERQDGFFKGTNYYVTFAFGHLFSLYDAKDYDAKYGTWKIENLPILPEKFRYKLIEDSGVKKQFKIIEKLMKDPNVTDVVNACDSDREGSLIFAEAFNAVGVNKPLQRLWVSSHTPEDLKTGFAKLKTAVQDGPLTQAGYSRQWVDWICGINLTVAATKLYSRDRKVLNVGRVILPTVNLVYQRDMEIKNFKPRKYFELLGTFQTDSGTYEGTYIQGNKTQFDAPDGLEPIIRAVKEQAGVIASVQTKRVTKGPGRLFNLTDLQGHITSKFSGFSAEKVLKTAQSLYEKQWISYPRTASRFLDDTQKETASRALEVVKGNFTNVKIEFKDSKTIFDSSKVDSHPALMPTYLVPKENELSPEEKIVYLEIVKRFCAQFAPMAVYDQTEAITDVVGHKFQTKGKLLVEPGWKAIYGVESDGDQEPELKVQLREKMPVTNVALKTLAKETKPPAHYTVQTLLAAMQNCGKSVEDETAILKGYVIGTSATRADILKKIEKVGYVQLKGKSYFITEMGANLIEIFPLKEMLAPEFTGRLEKQLKDMERGECQQDEFLQHVNTFVTEGIEKMKGIRGEISRGASQKGDVGLCPLCGCEIVEHEKFFGCSGYKRGCKFSVSKKNALLEKYGVKLVPKVLVKGLLAHDLKGMVKLGNQTVPVMLEQRGEYWNLKFIFGESEKIVLGPCPECGRDVVETPKAFSCSGFKETRCRFAIWKEDKILMSYGKKISATMAKSFLSKGKCTVKGLTSPKDRSKFEGEIEFYKNDRGYWGFKISRKN